MTTEINIVEILAFIFGSFLTIIGIILGVFAYSQKAFTVSLSDAIGRLQKAIESLAENVNKIDTRTAVDIARINERCARHCRD